MSIRKRLEDIEHLLHRLDTAIVIRDPGSSRSADAFEGLRRQIIQASKNRRTHTAHLIGLSQSIERGASLDLVKDRVDDFLKELGIEFLTDTAFVEAFEVIEGEGEGIECIEAAVIERLEDGQAVVISLGKARRFQSDVQSAIRTDGPVVLTDVPTEQRGFRSILTRYWVAVVSGLVVTNVITLVLLIK
jgi:hypothetical protein